MIAAEAAPSESAYHGCREELLCPNASSWQHEDVNKLAKIVLMNYDGSQARFLPGNGSQPTWSPDSTTVTYTRIMEDSEGKTVTQLYSVDADGSNAADPTLIATGTKYAQSPAYSPDGSQLAYIGRESSSEPWGVYVARADGAEAKRLDLGEITEADTPQFTTDGEHLIFLGITPHGKPEVGYEEVPPTPKPLIRNVYEINTDGSDLTQLTHNEEEQDSASPTPGPHEFIIVTTPFAVGEAGPGIVYIKGTSRLVSVPYEPESKPTPLPLPPKGEDLTDVTRGVLGPPHIAKADVCDPPGGWGAIPTWCTSYRLNQEDELEPGATLTPVAKDSASTPEKRTQFEIHIGGSSDAPSSQRWVTVRVTPGTYAIGNAENGWLLNATELSHRTNSRGYSAFYYFGSLQQTAVSPGGLSFSSADDQCGWVLAGLLRDAIVRSLDEAPCTSLPELEFQKYSAYTNCPANHHCKGGTAVPLVQPAVECANLKFNEAGEPSGCVDALNTVPARTCVEWRYITKPALNGSGQWAMVKDPARYDWNGSWLFIPRSSIPATLPNYFTPGEAPCSASPHYPARDG